MQMVPEYIGQTKGRTRELSGVDMRISGTHDTWTPWSWRTKYSTLLFAKGALTIWNWFRFGWGTVGLELCSLQVRCTQDRNI